jgi:hypothetical protein
MRGAAVRPGSLVSTNHLNVPESRSRTIIADHRIHGNASHPVGHSFASLTLGVQAVFRHAAPRHAWRERGRIPHARLALLAAGVVDRFGL